MNPYFDISSKTQFCQNVTYDFIAFSQRPAPGTVCISNEVLEHIDLEFSSRLLMVQDVVVSEHILENILPENLRCRTIWNILSRSIWFWTISRGQNLQKQ